MSNQIVISSGAKVRSLEGVLTGTSGVVNALGINVPSGIPQLDGSGKILVSQLPNSVMEYKGSWNAATNTPTLVNGTGNAGDVYLCEVAGTVNFGAGPITFAIGDQVIYSGTTWQRASGATGTVTSVAVSRDGDALTITGSPITTSGTINLGFSGSNAQYINGEGDLVTFPSLTGFVPYTGATANVDLGNFNFDANEISGGAIIAKLNGPASSPFILKSGSSGYVIGDDAISLVSSPTTANTLILASNIGVVTKTAQIGLGSLSATRTFTLPDASGTIALTSNLSAYVPYTGATANVDLGNFTFNAGTVTSIGGMSALDYFANGFPASNSAGTISLYQAGNVSVTSGYTVLASQTSTQFGIFMGGSKNIILDSSLLSTQRIYNFPNAAGTIALTSDIPAVAGVYLPLAGGTLTGGLIGTTGSFSSSGSGNTFDINHTSGSGIALNITKGGNGEGLVINKTSGSGNALSVTGSTSLGALSGTSASFSLDILVNGLTIGRGGSAVVGNTAIGLNSLLTNTTGVNNSALGYNSLRLNTTGGNNTAIGVNALQNNTTASFNTAIGNNSLNANTTGASNTAIGSESLIANTTGSSNVAIGSISLSANTTGSFNTALGSYSLLNNTTGDDNTAIGFTSLSSNTTGIHNTTIGFDSLSANTTGNENTGLGHSALKLNTTGQYNTALGSSALYYLTTGSLNIAIGRQAGLNITTGSNNTIIGNYAGTAALANNIVLADGAGNIRYQFNGTSNVFTNPISATTATFSSSITVSGISVGTAGNGSNIKLGDTNFGAITTGSNNIAIGSSALSSITTSNANIGIGNSALASVVDGAFNIALGFGVGASITSGSNNTLFGYGAGQSITTGNYNTILGAYAGTAGMSNNIVLADGQGNVRYQWDGTNTLLGQSGNVGIGTSSPSGKLSLYDTSDLWLNIAKGSSFVNIGVDSTGTFYNTNSNHRWLYNSGSNEAMRITSGGNVGIGTSSPLGGYKLTLTGTGGSIAALASGSGDANFYSSSTTIGYHFFGESGTAKFYVVNGGQIHSTSATISLITSDRELKTEIKDYDKGLAEVLEMKPRYYKYKENLEKQEIGFIAQEIDEALEGSMINSIIKNEETGENYKTYKVEWFPLLVKAIQEQTQIIKNLEARIKQLENK